MSNKILLLAASFLLLLIISCSKEETKKGTATFGANYDVINCITNVTIYIDGEKMGKLNSYTHGITECGQPENLTRELSVGQHSYEVLIRPESGSGCTKDITGNILIYENECTKVFVDYFAVDF